jgi:hypothetical protein
VQLLRAQIAFASRRGSDAPPLLLEAARELEAVDPNLARATYLDALNAALFADRLAKGGSAVEVAQAVRSAPPSPHSPQASDLLLDGLALLITDGPSVGTPVLKRAVGAFHDEDLATEEGMRWLWLAGRAAGFIWDYEGWDALTARQIQVARNVGALAVLPLALSTLRSRGVGVNRHHTFSRLRTSDTPGTRKAIRSAASRPDALSTAPRSVTSPPSTSTSIP